MCLGFPTRSDTNRAAQLQKIARGMKFRVWEEEGLYYPYSENKGADLKLKHVYRAADFAYAKIRFSINKKVKTDYLRLLCCCCCRCCCVRVLRPTNR